MSGPLSGPLSGGVREGVRNPVRNVRSVSGDVRSILDSTMCTHVRCCPVFSPVMYGGVPRWYPARPTVRQYALKLYLFAMACVQLAPDSLGKRLSKDLSGSKGRRECAETRSETECQPSAPRHPGKGGSPPTSASTSALKLDLFAMACMQLAPDSLGKWLSEVVRQQRAQRTRRD